MFSGHLASAAAPRWAMMSGLRLLLMGPQRVLWAFWTAGLLPTQGGNLYILCGLGTDSRHPGAMGVRGREPSIHQWCTVGGFVALTTDSVTHIVLPLLANWRDVAACRDTAPDLFFPVGTTGLAVEQIEAAKSRLRACPVKAPCLQFALISNQDSGHLGRHVRGRAAPAAPRLVQAAAPRPDRSSAPVASRCRSGQPAPVRHWCLDHRRGRDHDRRHRGRARRTCARS